MAESGSRTKIRSKNPFESPSCPEAYQQASCSPQSSELYHYISMSPEEFKNFRNISTPARNTRFRNASLMTIGSNEEQQAYQNDNIFDDVSIETPCKQVAQLNLHDMKNSLKDNKTKDNKTKDKKNTGAKLLGSKSLSHFMSKINRRNSSPTVDKQRTQIKLRAEQSSDYKNTINIILPRKLTHNLLQGKLEDYSPAALQVDVELGGRKRGGVLMHKSGYSAPALPTNSSTNNDQQQPGPSGSSGSTDKNSKEKAQKATRYKPLKSTALVLRDVKNSIRLRLKAKRANHEFEKLAEDSMMVSPNIKLYSPFNIYTPSLKESAGGSRKKEAKKSKKRLDLAGHENNNIDDNVIGSNSKANNNETSPRTKKSLKSKIALRHKKHLMQANKFAFNSPTGRLRETVRDVEQLQQCIEDISEAIRDRRTPLLDQ